MNKPIELQQAITAKETAWDKYIDAINANVDTATRKQYLEVVNITEERERMMYSEWQKIGGTSNISTIALQLTKAVETIRSQAAEIERLNKQAEVLYDAANQAVGHVAAANYPERQREAYDHIEKAYSTKGSSTDKQ